MCVHASYCWLLSSFSATFSEIPIPVSVPHSDSSFSPTFSGILIPVSVSHSVGFRFQFQSHIQWDSNPRFSATFSGILITDSVAKVPSPPFPYSVGFRFQIQCHSEISIPDSVWDSGLSEIQSTHSVQPPIDLHFHFVIKKLRWRGGACTVTIYDEYIRLITRVSVRYGEIFHEPKASEISRHISQLTSVISALFL